MGKTHKLVGHTVETYCPIWIGFTKSGHFSNADEYYASRWWKYVTCKLCLKFRKVAPQEGKGDVRS